MSTGCVWKLSWTFQLSESETSVILRTTVAFLFPDVTLREWLLFASVIFLFQAWWWDVAILTVILIEGLSTLSSQWGGTSNFKLGFKLCESWWFKWQRTLCRVSNSLSPFSLKGCHNSFFLPSFTPVTVRLVWHIWPLQFVSQALHWWWPDDGPSCEGALTAWFHPGTWVQNPGDALWIYPVGAAGCWCRPLTQGESLAQWQGQLCSDWGHSQGQWP